MGDIYHSPVLSVLLRVFHLDTTDVSNLGTQDSGSDRAILFCPRYENTNVGRNDRERFPLTSCRGTADIPAAECKVVGTRTFRSCDKRSSWSGQVNSVRQCRLYSSATRVDGNVDKTWCLWLCVPSAVTPLLEFFCISLQLQYVHELMHDYKFHCTSFG